MSAEQIPTLNQPCTCADVIGDSDIERLHRLMNAGMSQRESSLLLWSGSIALRDSIRARMLAWFPDLRLPEVGSL